MKNQLAALSPLLKSGVNKYLEEFYALNPGYSQWFEQALANKYLREQLETLWACSPFCATLCQRRPDLLQAIIAEQSFSRAYGDHEFTDKLNALSEKIVDESSLNKCLRDFRNTEMLRIIWRDLNRLSDLKETTRSMSLLAEATVTFALDFHYKNMSEDLGTPTAIINNKPVPQQLVILGMGKLGAYELNLSSDIDLIFAYPSKGETVGGKKTVDNQTFFVRVGQRIIQSIDNITADGFVFRVDMRLRPYGNSGALVLSFSAMEAYYQDQGREWERYAMIKARPIAGDLEQGEVLMRALRPFIYRRYIDYSVVDALRSMKIMIEQEVKRRRLDNDIKIGAGGIREVEFIAQSFQLIRGGREKQLQERSLQIVLAVLAEKKYLPVTAVAELQQAYMFLRNTEHVIQAFNDRQTQALPDDELAQAALIHVMGFSDWPTFKENLDFHREKISHHFQQIIADNHQDDMAPVDSFWQGVWLGQYEQQAACELLVQYRHEDAGAVCKRLQQLREDDVVQRLQPVARERLDQFMPLLLQAIQQSDCPSKTLVAIIPLVESVLRRSAYLVLLIENSHSLSQLIILCSASPWIAQQLARHPVLLDELLDSRTLYHVPDKGQLRDELYQQLLRIPRDDLESHMEAVRYFKQAHQLHVSAAEVIGQLPLMKVSDYLTIIAEVILEQVLDLAWDNLIEKHGRPQRSDGEPCEKDFIIVGYGKVGGIEMGHHSDLDLVFVHDAASNVETDGPRPIDNSMFFARLGQRIIHILTAQTPLGDLYETDMRLRPSGASGLLVSSLQAFDDYQRKEAWAWEHQALVRARVIAGDKALGKRFEALRRDLLSLPRDSVALQKDVLSMRKKMREHLGSSATEEKNQFHIKHDAGGIVDIEFLTQYLVLNYAQQCPAAVVWSDNIRILESLHNAGVMSGEEAQALSAVYKTLRSATHRLALQQQNNIVSAKEFVEERTLVKTLWQRWLVVDI